MLGWCLSLSARAATVSTSPVEAGFGEYAEGGGGCGLDRWVRGGSLDHWSAWCIFGESVVGDIVERVKDGQLVLKMFRGQL